MVPELWAIEPLYIHADEQHLFRQGLLTLEQLVFKVEMYLYLVFDWIAQNMSEWLVKMVCTAF